MGSKRALRTWLEVECRRGHLRRHLLPGILLGLGLLAGGTGAAASIDSYGRLPTIEEIKLSPEGTLVALVRTDGEQRLVIVKTLPEGRIVAGARVGEAKLRSLEWADESHLLIMASTTARISGLNSGRVEWFLLSVLDTATNKTYPLTQRIRGVATLNVVTGQPMVRKVGGHSVLFITGYHVTTMTLPALFSYDLATATEELVERGDVTTRQWFVDEAGRVVARTHYNEQSRHWSVDLLHNNRWITPWSGESATTEPVVGGFGPRVGTLLIQASRGETPVTHLAALYGPSAETPLPQLEIDRPIFDPLTYHLIGGEREVEEPQYQFLDSEANERWQGIVAAFPGERVRLASSSASLEKAIIRVDGLHHGYAYYFVDNLTHHAIQIGAVYEGLSDLYETRQISYKAGDGLEIPAYLTLPAGKSAHLLPLVVLVHGGPAVRDTADFDWWSQALASQGYAVLRPNYRGSLVSLHFMEAGFGEWGRKMQTDLSDGVHSLVADGTVDPKRVCIAGASYGGYAALAGVTLDPGTYRCAVSVAGLSDLHRFLRWSTEVHRPDNTSERYWDRFMGAADDNDPILDAISPARHADRVSAPVLLVHGKDDTTVPYEQSEIMLSALRRAHKPAELITLKNEDHWLSHGDTRLKMLQASIEFLRANNPPD